MDILIRLIREGKECGVVYRNVEQVVFFDHVKAKLMVDKECNPKTPVRPRDMDTYKYVEEDV